MNCIDDRANGIIINHNSDWSGNVRIVWYVASERRGDDEDHGIPPSMVCWCNGRDLVNGLLTMAEGSEPPLNVITRSVALAVETNLRTKAISAAESLFINRGKL